VNAHGLTLVLNVGSSSLKAAVLEATTGSAQRLWQAEAPRDGALVEQLDRWLAPQLHPWWPRLQAAGHRVVHGGERFIATTRITPVVLQELEALSALAPLHNPPALAAIHWLGQQRPALPQWACFDTAFHATLPAEATTYALPAAWRQGGCRRYGFHGLNHQHLAETAACPRLISAHLGAGCSLAAIRNGRSIDTTMGFTPLEGLVMASRSGSVDPGLLLHLQRQGLSLEELDQGLNHRSGLLGLSGLSGDWRQLRSAAANGHAGAALAVGVFVNRLRQGIGAMAASLGGVDQITLSGGIGANDPELLAELTKSMAWLKPVAWQQIPADAGRDDRPTDRSGTQRSGRSGVWCSRRLRRRRSAFSGSGASSPASSRNVCSTGSGTRTSKMRSIRASIENRWALMFSRSAIACCIASRSPASAGPEAAAGVRVVSPSPCCFCSSSRARPARVRKD